MHRRSILRWLAGAASLGAAGCSGSLLGGSAGLGSSPSDETTPCDAHVYRGPTPLDAGALPWDLEIRNIGLSVVPVDIEIAELGVATPTTVVSCTATTASHARLAFDLPTAAEYRVRATLHRPDDVETASTTVSGAQLGRSDAALEVTVDRGVGFTIRQVHVDDGVAAT